MERRDFDAAAAWGGTQVFDWYGVGDTGVIIAEATPGGGL